MAVSDAKRPRALEDENARLSRLLADAMLDSEADQMTVRGTVIPLSRSEGSADKRMATPAARRDAVAHLQATLGMSARRACTLAGADRTTMRDRSCRADDVELWARLREQAWQRRRFGDRRLHVLLRRDGLTNHRKETQRLYCEKGLVVRRRKGRRRTTGSRATAPVLASPNQR